MNTSSLRIKMLLTTAMVALVAMCILSPARAAEQFDRTILSILEPNPPTYSE